MTIIISGNGKEPKILEPESFKDEKAMQKFIANNPESLGLMQYKDDINLRIICREYPTLHGESIDHIGVDQDGDIYIIETKNYANPDKRKVVAQIIDYGATFWSTRDFEDFEIKVNAWLKKNRNTSLNDELEQFGEDKFEDLKEKIEDNFSNSRFKFVIVMDKVDDKTKNIVHFLTENSEFTIILIEFKHYSHDGNDITVPELYGHEIEKTKKSTQRKHYDWDRQELFDYISDFTENEINAVKNVHDFIESYGSNSVRYGHSSQPRCMGYFNQSRSAFSIRSQDLKLRFDRGPFSPDDWEKIVKKCDQVGFGISVELEKGVKEPAVEKEKWVPKVNEFIEILKEFFPK